MSDPTDQLRRYAEQIATSVTPGRSQVAVTRAIAAATRPPPRRWLRGQVATSVLAGLVVLNVGAMAVADPAVPGDFLYPLDRTYERIADAIGIGADRTAERVEEAGVLLERSDPLRALQVLAEIDNPEVSGVATSLSNTAADHPLFASHVTALVTTMHGYAASDDDRSKAEALAAVRLIGDQVADIANDAGGGAPPAHAGTQGPPDHSDTQGPPDHSSGNQGNEGNQGKNGGGTSGQHSPPDHADTQGPPDHSDSQGPPEHSSGNQGNDGNEGNEGNQGNNGGGNSDRQSPPDDADTQGPPDHSETQGPPDHSSGNQGNDGNQGDPPDHSNSQGPPDHSDQKGPPDHAGGPGKGNSGG